VTGLIVKEAKMTEGMEATSQNNGISSSVNSPASAPVATSASEERSFKQSEVNDIVKRAKNDAVETFKRVQSEQPQYAQQKYGETAQQSQPVQTSPGSPGDDHYRKIAAEEAQRLRDQWVKDAQTRAEAENAQRTVQAFYNKISPGREKYEDFDKVTSDIQYAKFPNVIQLLADYVDNSHDVLYELGKDRIKMANLEVLANMSPQDAVIQAQRLSKSIKDNEEATNTKHPNEPLSQLRPSNAGTDSGVMSVKDFRKKYKA
jgi:hypothetical protein